MQFMAKPEQAILLIEYLWDPSFENGAALMESLSGMPIKTITADDKLYADVANRAIELTEMVRKLQMVPAHTAGHVRTFHSMLHLPSEFTNGDPWVAIDHVLTAGLSVKMAHEYTDQYGNFRGIWTQTDEPYNVHVPWFAIDLPTQTVSPYALREIYDARRTQPYLLILPNDVPPEWIVAVNGLPTWMVEKALAAR